VSTTQTFGSSIDDGEGVAELLDHLHLFVVDPQLTLDAMARALPGGVVIVGAGSARRDLATLVPTYQFCNERIAQDGVAVLLFSGPIAYSLAVGTGWRTLGVTGTVTRTEQGVVAEIGGRPAVEFLAPYLDVTGPPSFGNPLAVVEVGSERSYLRAIVGSDPLTGAPRPGPAGCRACRAGRGHPGGRRRSRPACGPRAGGATSASGR